MECSIFKSDNRILVRVYDGEGRTETTSLPIEEFVKLVSTVLDTCGYKVESK